MGFEPFVFSSALHSLPQYVEQKIMRTKNTLYLDEVDISLAYAPELENPSDLEIIAPAQTLKLEKDGYFTKFLDH
jgi:hypothetical protein